MPEETSPETVKTAGLLKELSMDEQVQIMYEAREKARRDHEAKIRFAENEGIERNKREIAQKLLGLHAPLDMILQATGLPLSDIQSLQQQAPLTPPVNISPNNLHTSQECATMHTSPTLTIREVVHGRLSLQNPQAANPPV
ncbi:MAG: hypothetical protein LBN04_12180 [Oscillospiraceae bacterium]|jgi:hypothetical protein|nr:hypothetical protein [Oscillospiraceae bacterium]